jgi:hypothetical protein
MAVIHVEAQLSTEQLLKAVAQMSGAEFKRFIQRATALRSKSVIIERRGKTPVALVPKRKRKMNGKKLPSPVETSSQRAARLAKKLGNRYRLSPRQQRRLEALAKKNKQGMLTPEENKEMFDLLAEYDRMTLLRAKAMGAME